MIAIEPLLQMTPDCRTMADNARGEGWRFMDRLLREWARGENRFDGAGECLLGAYAAGVLIGVGGINRDPYVGDGLVGRMRHIFVRPAWRKQGVGQRLVRAILDTPHGFQTVRLRTDNAAAARLYERLGFDNVTTDEATHSRQIRRALRYPTHTSGF